MTTLIHEPRQTMEPAGDPFHDPLLGAIAATFIVLALVVVMLTGLIIWGVQYRTPGWNSNSYPAPVGTAGRSRAARDGVLFEGVSAGTRQRGRFLQGRPPIRSAEKPSQRPNDYRIVSGDAPNRSCTDFFCKAAAAFLYLSVALLIVGQPLQKATALSETAQRVARQPPAQAARNAKHGNRVERHSRGEFRPRVFDARSTPGVFSRVADRVRISQYSPRSRESTERKPISGAQRRRLTADALWRPGPHGDRPCRKRPRFLSGIALPQGC